MRNTLSPTPTTLGEALTGNVAPKPGTRPGAGVWAFLKRVLNLALVVCILVLCVSWLLGGMNWDQGAVLVPLTALVIFWGFLNRKVGRIKQHVLLKNDRQGFMHRLRLDEKTAVFDGSNIYHFGHDNGLDAQPLGEIAHRLRTQGYRIVCFFDANIFHRLGEHGAFPRGERHSWAMLEDIFGLNGDEIYVVPSGVQADRYILECLENMPISFAVTNDRFRDYADQYPDVMKDNLWRKGVVISDGEIRLR